MEQIRILGISTSPRILGISTSPRHANTEIAVKEALAGATDLPGVETEFYSLVGKKFNPCMGDFRCCSNDATKDNPCPRWGPDDDMVVLVKKWAEFDGFIFGTPTYVGGISSQMKALWDRGAMMCQGLMSRGLSIRNKVAGAVTCAAFRNGGQETTLLDIWRMCSYLDLIPVGPGPDYKNKIGGGYGGVLTQWVDPTCHLYTVKYNSPKERTLGKEDEWGLLSCRNTGRRVAEIARVMKTGFKAVPREGTY